MPKINNRISPQKVNLGLLEILILFLGLFLIYFTIFVNFLLFHSITEIFSIIIAGGVFFVGWNSRKYMKNSFFLVLGVSSLFIAIFDIIHMLSYSGMQIFIGFDANLPTTIWVVARYLQAGSLLMGLFFLKKSIKPFYLLLTYLIISVILFVLIFSNYLPTSYIEGSGLTQFKIISEYIIILMLFFGLIIIIKNKTEFDKNILYLIIAAIVMLMLAEISFTFYVDDYSFSNLIGHLFRILAFYLLYKSIIQIGIEKPFDLLFRKIRRSELELRNIIDHSGAGITMLDENGIYLMVNEKAASDFGGKPEDFIGTSLYDVFPKKIADGYLIGNRELILTGINRSYQRTFDLPTGRKTFWITEQPLKDPGGDNGSLLSVLTDITERKLAEDEIKKREHDLGERVKELTCLYNISKLIEKKDISIKQVLEETISYLPPAWQYPEISCARILYKSHKITTANFRETEWVLKANIKEYENFVGVIEIYYLEEMPVYDEGPFLKEERLLINSISEMLRAFIERKRGEVEILNLSKFPSENPNPVLRVNKQQVIYSNKIGKRLFNIEKDNLIPKVLEDPVSNALTNRKTEELEVRLNNKTFTLAITPVENTDYVNVYGLDITERKKSEEKILNLSKFPSENPNPVLRINNQQVIYSNEIGKILFNINEENLIPKVLEETIINVLTNRKIEELEARLNGKTFTLAITPVENTDYVNVYGLDITERKKAEQKLSQLISTVSHELRTPITVLLMSIEYLTQNKSSLNKELEEKLMDGISRNIQLLNELAEDILIISRIDENRLELELKEYFPLEVIKDILYLMEPIGKEKNLDFEVEVDGHIHLRGDLKRIDQVFRIIIDNAIKYSFENSKIEIKAQNNYQGKYNLSGNKGVLFQFKNHGRGISKEDLPHIFERFFRGSNVDKITGTGLGLAIAKDLIKAHQGKIIIESELEKGTTIQLFLPQLE